MPCALHSVRRILSTYTLGKTFRSPQFPILWELLGSRTGSRSNEILHIEYVMLHKDLVVVASRSHRDAFCKSSAWCISLSRIPSRCSEQASYKLHHTGPPLSVNIHGAANDVIVRYGLHLDIMCSTMLGCLVKDLVVARSQCVNSTLFTRLIYSRGLIVCRLSILPQ